MRLKSLTPLLLCLFLWACGSQTISELTHEPGNPLVENGRWSALHSAIDRQDDREVQDLLKNGVNVRVIAASPKEHAITPLHLAVKNNMIPLSRQLIEKGALVNAEMGTGKTPLHFAVENGNISMVQLLLQQGASSNKESFYIHTPLKIAQDKGFSEIEGLLKKALEK